MEQFLVVRRSFQNPLPWRAANELLRRNKAKVIDRVRHWFWEWKAIETK